MTDDFKSQKIKVLQVITHLIRGGAQEDILLLTEHLDRKRYETKLAYGPARGNKGSLEKVVRQRGLSLKLIPHLFREVNPWNDLCALRELYSFIQQERFDIVHAHTSKAGFIGRLAARLARVPVIIYSTHGSIFQPRSEIEGVSGSRLRIKLFTLLERWAALFTDKIVTLSSSENTEFLNQGIGRPTQFTTVYAGIKLERFLKHQSNPSETKQSLGIPLTGPVVGSVGRLVSEKGYRYFVKAAAQVLVILPETKFIIAGDGPLRQALEKQARQLGISSALVFLGWQDNIPSILSIFDIFVLPSLYEGMGRVLVEAQAKGKPIVATRVGGVSEVVSEGKGALLVPPADPGALAQAIITLLQNPAHAQQMGEAGKKKVYPRFDITTMARRFDEIYQSISAQKQSRG